ncbi:hypothetical protein MKX01_003710 [Papaver californicum]|nr:hypothetical protein MKX01_003710 [Papaver californicum]
MASQMNFKPQKVASSATQDNFKSLISLDEGKSSVVTVRVTRKWKELDFTSTNDVTSVDMVMVDEQGDELHAMIPKNLIWKFDKQIRKGGTPPARAAQRVGRVGPTSSKLHLNDVKPKFHPTNSEKRGFFRWNTSLTAMDATVSIIPHNFCFTEFEALESNLQNIHLTCNFYYLNVVSNVIKSFGSQKN